MQNKTKTQHFNSVWSAQVILIYNTKQHRSNRIRN